jgi:general secretion pathway protein K
VKFPEGREFNELQRMLWERYLKPVFAYYEHPTETDPINAIVNSLKDWLDSGDDDAITGLSGAESDYYRDLDPPYDCRNAPLTHLDELLQVRGITPELYYGIEDLPGISTYLTVGVMTDNGAKKGTFDGRININTADIPVLMALLPEENQELATALFEYREEKDGEIYTHELSGNTWYKNVPGAGDLEIDAALITTRSDFFRITAEATLNDQTLRATVQVVRERVGESDRVRCRVLSWEPQ